MRQAIKRVAYDKRGEPYHLENMDDVSDAAYHVVELYKASQDRFFLVHLFGSCYAGDNYAALISTEEAVDWLEKNGGSEVVEQLLEDKEA